ncbi:unnamed protein product [Sphenostylis stenocarpa]|uniref:Uncharacterized protein n=1 Tax=Sphenostylis stenocarpa TaxID=92480 RepID=A0AA86VFY4_9FABA|nr:unnamed protein product [Sphenostylis stenocarpa]
MDVTMFQECKTITKNEVHTPFNTMKHPPPKELRNYRKHNDLVATPSATAASHLAR